MEVEEFILARKRMVGNYLEVKCVLHSLRLIKSICTSTLYQVKGHHHWEHGTQHLEWVDTSSFNIISSSNYLLSLPPPSHSLLSSLGTNHAYPHPSLIKPRPPWLWHHNEVDAGIFLVEFPVLEVSEVLEDVLGEEGSEGRH